MASDGAFRCCKVLQALDSANAGSAQFQILSAMLHFTSLKLAVP